MRTTPVRVDVWSDVQCIWCYISSSRLKTAISRFGGSVEVIHHSYQLTPDAPVEIDREQHISAQRVDPARMEQIMAQLRQLTAAEGLAYEPDLTQPTNSRLALELLHHAGERGRRGDLTERLFTAYFAEGRHVGRAETLLQLASEVGIDAEGAASALEQRRHSAAVDADIAQAHALGARGVPLYVIDHRWGLSGAQPVEEFVRAFERADPR